MTRSFSEAALPAPPLQDDIKPEVVVIDDTNDEVPSVPQKGFQDLYSKHCGDEVGSEVDMVDEDLQSFLFDETHHTYPQYG